MTDTTADTNIASEISTLKTTVNTMHENMVKLSSAMVAFLSGAPVTTAPAQTTGRRRGRPPKASGEAQATASTAPKAREAHPLERRSLELIEQRGRISQTELAETLSKETGKPVERAAVEYHTKELLKAGQIVKRTVMPNGVKTILYYRRDWASFRGE
jgi:hypothetical protein